MGCNELSCYCGKHVPTCVAAAGGTVDSAWKLDGVNLLPYLKGEISTRPHQALYWRIDGMSAMRHGDWTLVQGNTDQKGPELFDFAADIGEERNLAGQKPEKLQELQKLWTAWNDEPSPPQKAKAKAGKKAAKKKARAE